MLPLISVMIPCYNSSKTLPLALASLLSQTYENWECVLVDDGSHDNPRAIVDAFSDERIRLFRFEKNQGRGAARQQALDMAHGEYLCMLDADDWIYPSKIERQVDFMKDHPDLAVLSTNMAIVNDRNDIVGVRDNSNTDNYTIFPPMQRPDAPPISFAPSMLRASIAKQFSFDTKFKIAEDKDFLLRMLMENSCANIHDILYVYTEIESLRVNKITLSLSNNRRMYWKYRANHPISILKNITLSLAKELIYRGMFGVGYGDRLISRRSSEPTSEQKREFETARQIVMKTFQQIFG